MEEAAGGWSLFEETGRGSLKGSWVLFYIKFLPAGGYFYIFFWVFLLQDSISEFRIVDSF